MSNAYALQQAREEEYRKKRTLMADSYNDASSRNVPSQPYHDEQDAEQTRILREELNRQLAKHNLPIPPTYAKPADNGNRARRSDQVSANVNKPEYTGGSVSYYRVKVAKPTSKDLRPYEAECNDIIEALQLNYAEGNALKAIWRMAAARMGKMKKGYTDGLYDAEKVEFFGARLVAQNKASA